MAMIIIKHGCSQKTLRLNHLVNAACDPKGFKLGLITKHTLCYTYFKHSKSGFILVEKYTLCKVKDHK